MRRGDQNGRMVVAGVVIADTHQVGVCVGASRAVDGRGRRRRAGPRHGLHRRLSSIDARTHESLFWGMVVLVERETALGMREHAKDVRFWQSRIAPLRDFSRNSPKKASCLLSSLSIGRRRESAVGTPRTAASFHSAPRTSSYTPRRPARDARGMRLSHSRMPRMGVRGSGSNLYTVWV